MSATMMLLVEDNLVFLGILIAFLERAGIPDLTLRSARSGEDALAFARDERPDLLTVDLMLPGMSGVEAIARLRALLPNAAIVALTEHVEEAFRAAALAAGADEFVPKAELTRRLLPALQEAHLRHSAAAGSTAHSRRETS